MQKPTLDEEILLQVEQPARYTGGEISGVKKDLDKVKLRFAMCFPGAYEIGIGHLGIQILYSMLNRREDVYCKHVFLPWTDLDRILRERKTPFFILESRRPVQECDFLGITLQYEMCYTNILQVPEFSEIPLHVADRSNSDSIATGGGPCAYNPEPIAPFFDLFHMGKDEIIYDQLPDLYLAYKKTGGARNTFLKKAAVLPGIYVPSFYEPRCREDGIFDALEPLCPEASASVRRLVMSVLDRADFVDTLLMPFIRITQDRSVLEFMHGCIRGCHFRQIGNVYRPQRGHPVEYLERYAGKLLKIAGNEEISLSSLSSNDYPHLQELLEYLIQYIKECKTNTSLSSLRIGAFSLDAMQCIQDVKKSSLTSTPETGTRCPRDIINEGVMEEDIMRGVSSVFHGDWTKVRFYFMLGLPTETKEDRKGIPDLREGAASLFHDETPKSERVGRVQISANSSFFVPKSFTPFQWAPMCSVEEYRERARFVKETSKQEKNWKNLRYQYHDVGTTLMEGAFTHGDRRTIDVTKRTYRDGAIYDAWTEHFDAEHWANAFAAYGVDPDFYTQHTRSTDELLPWDFIDCGASKEFLKREQKSALEGKVAPNCREHYPGCDATSYQGGICFENKN